METAWSIRGTLMLSIYELQSGIKYIFFSEQLSLSYIHEIWFPMQNTARYFKQ